MKALKAIACLFVGFVCGIAAAEISGRLYMRLMFLSLFGPHSRRVIRVNAAQQHSMHFYMGIATWVAAISMIFTTLVMARILWIILTPQPGTTWTRRLRLNFR